VRHDGAGLAEFVYATALSDASSATGRHEPAPRLRESPIPATLAVIGGIRRVGYILAGEVKQGAGFGKLL
jgi:hypothetical protein